MKSFRVEQSQLVKVWQKFIIYVDAESEEDAKEIVKTFANEDVCENNFKYDNVCFLDSEFDSDTCVVVGPKENGGLPTIITKFEDGEELGNNAK